jgi:quercetin dioxygenase-like cupin family protein
VGYRSIRSHWKQQVSCIDILLSLLHPRSAYITNVEYSMKITDMAKVVSGSNPHHVDARKIYESPHAMAVVITLKPGEALKKHITPVDVFFYVLEGSGVVEIGDEKQTVGKDMLIESPARIPHRWSNEGTSVFRVLVVKVPKPTEETKLL